MTAESFDPFESEEPTTASVDAAPPPVPATEASVTVPTELEAAEAASIVAGSDAVIGAPVAEPALVTAEPIPAATVSRRFSFRRSSPRLPSSSRRHSRLAGFAVAFLVSVAAVLFIFTAAAVVAANVYRDRVLPGVHTGSVDLSGLTRDEAIAKLQSVYAYLAQGEVTVTTPVGVASITYQQAGRGPDVEAMADAAMAVGHSGNPLADAATVVHSAAFRPDIPVIVEVDPTALAERLHQLVATSLVAPKNAQVAADGGNFSVTPSTSGRGMNENAMGSTIIEQLASTSAPADLQAGGAFVTIPPQISDADAQSAIARAQKMMIDVKLTWDTPPEGASATWKAQSWTITADQIRSWIVFGTRPDGTYAPAVDPAQVQAYVASVTANDIIRPTEPTVVFDSSGKPSSLTAGKDGVGVDAAATTTAISAYLDSLASGSAASGTVEIVTGPIHPQISNIETVAGMVVVGKWTTTFYPDISNGMGKNIRQPATNLNGQVIGPGQHFSFLAGVGPIDKAHGFTMGGVIVGGKSDHTGAMGGGICSASTTMFNAAATAGLQIDERHAHYYYINRYPIGRDATVLSDGRTTWDLRWTNDTPYPIVIRAWTTYGSKSTITIQLWSVEQTRTVTWTGGGKANIVVAHNNPPEYVSTLKPGQQNIAEYATNGFDTGVTRVVTDASGAVIHQDVWYSHYTAVNGQVQIGGAPPAPAPTAPPVEPAPTPVPTAALLVVIPVARRRKAAK